MANLSISLLGPFRATRGGVPVTSFESNKVRALLAYLAVEAGRAHSRSVLAGLLWPDRTQRLALGNLRYALSNLRQAIGDSQAQPSFLLVSRDTLQLNPASDYELDTALLDAAANARDPTTEQLQSALALCRGSFLEGLSLADSPAFEEWMLLKRERFNQQLLKVLQRLTAAYERRGDYAQARLYAWRQVEVEPYQEEGHRQLMRLLALDGQRSAALAQYQSCRRLLMQELGVEPAQETTLLYERIRDGVAGEKTGRARAFALPAFLAGEEPAEATPAFVGRERELARLHGYLQESLAGRGQVVLVSGDAGSGKTSLVQAFVRSAIAAHGELVAAQGSGNAYIGAGDPCLPFVEIMQGLTGDVQAQWAGGAMTREQAKRLWALLPLATEALVEAGPDLVGRFVPAEPLFARARAFAAQAHLAGSVVERLEKLIAYSPPPPLPQAVPQQSDLFEQYVQMLQALAQERPLILVLDDLQWADEGTIDLLFHLGRKLAGQRILLIGAYRPGDLALRRNGRRHPLEPALLELQRQWGDMVIDLTQAEGRPFVDALIDAEPNLLGEEFRQALFEQTGGHALFTVALLRSLQEQGDLVHDDQGRWVAVGTPDWQRLPARVEAVIAEQVGRLSPGWQGMLSIAAVEGLEFTAEALALALKVDPQKLIALLSGTLARRYQLVSAAGLIRVGERRLARYRFRHYLFQRYLYNRLDEVERARAHEAIGSALESLHGEHAREVAVALAWHFAQAGRTAQAVSYSLQAGEKAARLAANQEALTHLRRGQALLETLPPSAERDRLELALQLAMSGPLRATASYGAEELGRVYARARELCRRLEAAPELFVARFGLATLFSAQAEYAAALELLEQLLATVRQAHDSTQEALACALKGFCLSSLGDCRRGRELLEQALALFRSRPQHEPSLFDLYGVDEEIASAWLTGPLFSLGYSDQALRIGTEVAARARASGNALRLAAALAVGLGFIDLFLRDYATARALAEELLQLGSEVGSFRSHGLVHLGRAMVRSGQCRQGVELAQQGVAAMRATGQLTGLSIALAGLAEAHGWAGQSAEALGVLAEALAFVERTGERLFEAELHRLRGALLAQAGDAVEAEASLHRAIEVAQKQEAKLFELRATVQLCRLWLGQGRRQEAAGLVAPLYAWFTEGLDTPDLREAKALLQELGV